MASYKELNVYRKSYELVREIYRQTESLPATEQYWTAEPDSACGGKYTAEHSRRVWQAEWRERDSEISFDGTRFLL